MSSNTIDPRREPLAVVDVVDLLEDGDALTFEFTNAFGHETEGFVMRWRGDLVAYENRCPHWAVPVGFDEHDFLEGQDIVCPMHGARFNPATGVCWEGPCIGDRLDKFEVSLDGTEATIRYRGLSLSFG